MNFDGTEKKLLKGSHDLWERNRKIVYRKIWNPRASCTKVMNYCKPWCFKLHQ